ncbi:membrane protein [Polycladomyces abyssicola]|uniref:Membrane protein n=1 Tax=Polycladomyces abyssicola TaxID=1125966 RepID=A0A8D5UEP7_9BACL|nr:ArsB/NhaD family transporter [Polycladomyces abyssicola]BCU81111.1 membrane protein [Polycladomyces abyssicola]
MGQTIIAIAIFLITYAVIVTEKINRAVISLLGASLLVLVGVLDIHRVFEHYIEWNTITLLIGMMILVGILNQTGVFQYVAIKAAKAAKGNPVRILIVFSLLTAVASAFLDNVTTVLLVVPITLAVTHILKVSPVPFFISEIIASNIGGTATLIGDPPNIMIGSANEHLTFNAFLIHLGPVIVVILAVSLLLLYWFYRKQLITDEEHVSRLMEMDEETYIQDRTLAKKSLFVLGLTILGFVLHSVIHVEASVIAITGATILMLIGLDKKEIEEAFDYVEWETIFFFAALFTLVGGLQEAGVIKHLAVQLLDFTKGNIPLAATLILWVSGIASAVIDNIPFVATMIPLIQNMATTLGLPVNSPEMNALWWSLALGACLGGNGTIIGASANVIVANMAARQGKGFSYMEYLKVGAPITLLSLAIAQVYLYLRYLIHF